MQETKIRNQIWTIQNLDVSHYRNGDPIPNIQDPEEWKNTKTGAWCYYDNNIENNKYGKIYNSYAVLDPRGLAPEGYRIPEHYDWLLLERLTEQTKESHNWQEQFKVQHAGYRSDNGNFFFLNGASGWWSKSLLKEDQIIAHFYTPDFKGHYYEPGDKSDLYWKPYTFNEGFYVRCIKEEYKTAAFVIDDAFNHPLQSVSFKYSPNCTFQEMLDNIYNTILIDKVSRYSYGKEWCIELFEDYTMLKEMYRSSDADAIPFDQKINQVYDRIYNQNYKLIIRRL
jgi:uncharacterized protein (TIGR02145 family)